MCFFVRTDLVLPLVLNVPRYGILFSSPGRFFSFPILAFRAGSSFFFQ